MRKFLDGTSAWVIGTIQILWGLIPYSTSSSSPSLFYTTMVRSPGGVEWLQFMAFTGLCLLLAVWQRRALVIMFGVCSIVWFSTFSIFAHEGIVTPVTLAMPVFGLACLTRMFAEVLKKKEQ